MINPYFIIAAMVVWAGTMLGAYRYGESVKADSIAAQAAHETKLLEDASDAAAAATAKVLAEMHPKNVALQQETIREIRANSFYESCQHSPGQLLRINAALIGASGAKPPGGGGVPGADAAHR